MKNLENKIQALQEDFKNTDAYQNGEPDLSLKIGRAHV